MVPECQYLPEFVSDPEALYAQVLSEVPWTEQMASRQTASMGVPYIYKGATYGVNPWLPAVQILRERVAETFGFMPSNCLLNHYPTGRHSLGWHSDDVGILAPGTGIAILSLGVQRPLRLRRHGPEGYLYTEQVLAPGSMLYMTQAMQAIWQHSLRRAPDPEHPPFGRISLSFRQIVRWPEA